MCVRARARVKPGFDIQEDEAAEGGSKGVK